MNGANHTGLEGVLGIDLMNEVQPLVKNPPVFGEFGRELVAEDIVLMESSPLGSVAPGIKKLRSSHHNLARLLSTGMKQVEISAVTGFSQSRISILKKDPTFKELLTHYQSNEESRMLEIGDALKNLSLDAVEEIHDRLKEGAEELTIGSLLKIAEMSLDRSGAGPSSNVNVSGALITQEDMNAIKAASDKTQIYSKAERLQSYREDSLGKTEGQGAGMGSKEVNSITIQGEVIREEGGKEVK